MKCFKSAYVIGSIIVFGWSNLANATYFQRVSPSEELRTTAPVTAKASRANYVNADLDSLRQLLLDNDAIDVELPLPDGTTAIYHFELSPIAEQPLLDKYPQLRTFKGVDVTNSRNKGRFSITPLGFHGMFRHNGDVVLIDPQYRDSSRYMSYRAKDAQRRVPRPADIVDFSGLAQRYLQYKSVTAAKDGGSDGTLRTYRLAVAATGEYTEYFSTDADPSVRRAAAQAAIVVAINRVNEVYGDDLGIFLQLIGANDSVVYPDQTTDPYVSGTDFLSVNQTVIDTNIGSANYDIGHLFDTGSGGVAFLGSVCNNSNKAGGYTGLDEPDTDVFYIEFVSHEIGHQFGANHTFNGTTGSCGFGNRNATTAYETGSGSTIMGYAGICGGEDLQDTTDPYFHAGSIAEITRFITTGQYSAAGTIVTNTAVTSCDVESTPANNLPDALAGSDYTIPANTPISLSGIGTDADAGDTLSYTWEQMNVGTASSSTSEWVDDGSRTLTRSYEPTDFTSGADVERFIPNIAEYIDRDQDGVFPNGETLPTTNRTLTFRLTVRDGSGGTAYEDKLLTVTTSAGPFDLLTPEDDDVWTQGTVPITWSVANTDVAPVSCTQVDIYYNGDIVDGTDDYTPTSFTLLAAGEANDGEALVTAPATATLNGRVLIACADGAFYSMSEEAFEVSSGTAVIVSSVSNGSANEGSPITFNVTMSAVPGAIQVVNFGVSTVTASGADLNTISFSGGVTNNGDGTISIPAGTVTFSITVTTNDDSSDEGDETFTVAVGSASGIGTIVDNDGSSDSGSGSGNFGAPYSNIPNNGSGGSLSFGTLILLAILTLFRQRKWLL